MQMGEWLSLGQLLVLLATGGVVAWYTYETFRLRQTAQSQLESQADQLNVQLEQIEIQVRPLVVLKPDSGRGTVSLENVGYGPALNVSVGDVLIHERLEGFPLTLRFPEHIPVLKPQEAVSIPVVSYMGESEFGDFFSGALHPEFNVAQIDVAIEYDNLQLKRYRVVQSIEPKSMRISGLMLE